MRDMFTYKPPVTKEQFFNAGFAERKIIMCADVIQMIRQKNKSLQPNKKSTTSAVSTISHNLNKKSSRPKLTDLTRPPSQSVTAKSSSRPGSADHKQVTFASEEVVNELKQPPKYQGSRHVAHKEPPSPVTIVNMSPGVTKEIVRMDEHPSRGFRYAVVTPAIAKLPCKLSRTSDTNASKGLNFDECDDIEVVNATSPDASLYEPIHNSTSIAQEEMQDHLSTLQHSVELVTERLSGFESAMTSVTKLMQDHQTSTDPHLIDVVTRIQQQIENLTARMVLMENRVSIVESKIEKSSSPSARSSEPLVNGQRDQYTSHSPKEIRHKEIQGYMSKESYPSEVQRYTTTEIRPKESQKYSAEQNRPSVIHKTTTESHTYPSNQAQHLESNSKYVGSKENHLQHQVPNGQTVQPDHVDPSHNSHSANYSGNTSIPSHLTSADQFSFALSPIRTLKDSSVLKPGQNTTCEDTFALEAEDDARRSSTPTDFKDLPIRTTCEDSLSFQCGDVSMQQRVDRIKNMMVSTKTMLNH
ncbi:centrosomal protein CEP44 [Mytilus galloprovincialis]|uniref:Centrosomal protein of 44 kDa n=1 Tax=Mytilus galloprovincialis TaxID=29158 RepID=A0A8B6CRX4_MYTGA|nr:centrosomal protein CEP44 [Mytilus galloprovincialis]